MAQITVLEATVGRCEACKRRGLVLPMPRSNEGGKWMMAYICPPCTLTDEWKTVAAQAAVPAEVVDQVVRYEMVGTEVDLTA